LFDPKLSLRNCCGSSVSALAARAATSTIPIVFAGISQPVRFGLVASLNRPGGNVTGVSVFASELSAKRLELLHQTVPRANVIAMLLNPNGPAAEIQTKDARAAAHALGLQVRIMNASTESDFGEVFANLSQPGTGALIVVPDPFLDGHREQLVAFVARHGIPAIFGWREFVEAGGLMSYGTNLADSYRQAGLYVGRVLKGEKPADLPVALPTKFDFLINLKTAKSLGLDIPPTLLATADEVIE
jgi:putative ABC transport system substrate-binding protein